MDTKNRRTETMKEHIEVWFKELIKNEIEDGVKYYKSNLSYILDAKKKKLISDSYGNKIADALQDVSELSSESKRNIELLLSLYLSETCASIFGKFEDGEISDDIGRINFNLTAVNDTTGEETTLISADENDDTDNDFQGWILDNCSGLSSEEN